LGMVAFVFVEGGIDEVEFVKDETACLEDHMDRPGAPTGGAPRPYR
jgi:hypothetical protein